MIATVARRGIVSVVAAALAVGIVLSPIVSTTTFAASNAVATYRNTRVAYTKILVSSDGKVVMVCRYTADHTLLFCDINPGR